MALGQAHPFRHMGVAFTRRQQQDGLLVFYDYVTV